MKTLGRAFALSRLDHRIGPRRVFRLPRVSDGPSAEHDFAELERCLSVAKNACVERQPEGPACAEAARITIEIANLGRR